MAIPYFHMANCHTIIGAKRFHFRVRDGIGWFTLAMVTKQFGAESRLKSTRLNKIVAALFAFAPLSFASALRPRLCNSSAGKSRGPWALLFRLGSFTFHLLHGNLYSVFSRFSVVNCAGPAWVRAVLAFRLWPCACFSSRLGVIGSSLTGN